MKRNLSLWQLAGFAFTSIGGTLLHFLYDLTGQSVVAAPFSAVNESTWEHMKLLFFPMFVFALVQSRFFGERPDFWCVKLAGSTAGLALIPVLFYTYNGAIGKSPGAVNIAIFFAAAAASFILECALFKKGNVKCRLPYLAFALLCLIGVLFAVFTFAPPYLPLLEDPITGTYGIPL